MANFFSASEEEQLELISSIWDRYKYLILALLAAISISIIYREYSISSSDSLQYESSREYENFLSTEGEGKTLSASRIIESYPKSLYANFASLYLAKIKVEANDLKAAKIHLSSVLEQSTLSWGQTFNPLNSVARLRLARVLLEEGDAESALNLVNEATILTPSLYEVKGDAEILLGLVGEAKVSYLQALELNTSQPIKALISMKISDLQESK
jgi:predicted negative regulator of RcsB-dependent stress response